MHAVEAGFTGHAPSVNITSSPRPEEAELYRRMWTHSEYRQTAPGESLSQDFLNKCKPTKGSSVLDAGCGTGRGGFQLALFGMNVTMLDFADNCLDEDIRDILPAQSHALRFIVQDLKQPLIEKFSYGFCTDVLEHISEQDVKSVLSNLLQACRTLYLNISTVDDVMGSLVGHRLHLIVKPLSWWVQLLDSLGADISFSGQTNVSCTIVASAWQTARKLIEHGEVNVTDTFIMENIVSCLKRDLPEAGPFSPNTEMVVLLGGGPSMNEEKETIKNLIDSGCSLVTTNGAYNWALENDFTPKGQIIVDAREMNVRFVRPTVDKCKYFLASQCHPSLFDAVPREQIITWHGVLNGKIAELISQHRSEYYAVAGGSTVMLRALSLLNMLGFRSIHVFGFDSCVKDANVHHAYGQPENDDEKLLSVECNGRMFKCTGWMASQAQEFMDQVAIMPDLDLQIHGDGLISYLVDTGAQIAIKELS